MAETMVSRLSWRLVVQRHGFSVTYHKALRLDDFRAGEGNFRRGARRKEVANLGAARVVSIQVGLPMHYRDEANGSGQWYSAFVKQPVNGRQYVRFDNIEGDRQADLKNHGGYDKAVLCYAAYHYREWQTELNQHFPYGGFGENFTIEGLDETNVCIGDIFKVGECTLQVSQSRGPCWKIFRRWSIPNLLDRIRATGRTGWYMRVLKEGYVAPGQSIKLLGRTHPRWTVARVNDVREHRLRDCEEIRDLLKVNELSAEARKITEICLRKIENSGI